MTAGPLRERYPKDEHGRPHWLAAFVVRAILNVAAVWVAVRLLGGIRSDGEWTTYLLAGLVLAAVNSIVRPVAIILSLPLIVLTLGVAYLLVGVGMLALTAWLISGLAIDGFWSAVGGAIVIWLVNWALSSVLELDHGYPRRKDARGGR